MALRPGPALFVEACYRPRQFEPAALLQFLTWSLAALLANRVGCGFSRPYPVPCRAGGQWEAKADANQIIYRFGASVCTCTRYYIPCNYDQVNSITK